MEAWPESRLRLFEMACEHWLVSEHNREHQVWASREPVANIMDAAGYLCRATAAGGYRRLCIVTRVGLPLVRAGSIVSTVVPDFRSA